MFIIRDKVWEQTLLGRSIQKLHQTHTVERSKCDMNIEERCIACLIADLERDENAFIVYCKLDTQLTAELDDYTRHTVINGRWAVIF